MPEQDVVSSNIQAKVIAQQHQSDQALLQACRRGDAQAWETLLKTYERLVFSIALRYGLSQDDAADIVQLTFTILLESLDNLADDSRLAPWLATVAKRHTWRLLKRRERQDVNEAEDLADSAMLLAHIDPDFTRHWAILDWLNYGLTHLDQRCQQLLSALYLDERQPSYAEVATLLQMSVGSIGPTRARCLERLRQILQDT